jgi:hypothetical protein
MEQFNVNIFNQNYILIKLINLLACKYSLLKNNNKSLFYNNNIKKNHFRSNRYYNNNERKFNYQLVKYMLGYKISKVLYDNKIIDNIKLIISIRPNVRRNILY